MMLLSFSLSAVSQVRGHATLIGSQSSSIKADQGDTFTASIIKSVADKAKEH